MPERLLPSHKRRADYNNLNAYPFPLVPGLQKFLTDRTGLARLIEDAYDTSLRRIGLRTDFIDDILRDFGGKQERFGQDMKTLNGFVTAQGGPPVVGMVLDNLPEYNGRLYKIAKVAERHMTEAGMEVVPTENYYQRYNGRDFRVSRWEGHPNEEANAIFAAMLERQLLARSDLSAFRRDARTGRPMP